MSKFVFTTINGDVYVFSNGQQLLCLSREEALELSCKLEQAAQKIGGSEDSAD